LRNVYQSTKAHGIKAPFFFLTFCIRPRACMLIGFCKASVFHFVSKVSLTKTKKKGSSAKHSLVDAIRQSLDEYSHIFLFSVDNMRNSKLKDIRDEWTDSRFYFGKNRVMAVALGSSAEKELRTNLSKISLSLRGQRGLLFTNRSKEEVVNWFEMYVEPDFARSGNIATDTVILKEGPLDQFSHSLEPHLRQLGLPTTLKKGIINIISEHKVCDAGKPLTPDQARILKLMGIKMVNFKLTLIASWSNTGDYELHSTDESAERMEFEESDEDWSDVDSDEQNAPNAKKSKKEKKKSKSKKRNIWFYHGETKTRNNLQMSVCVFSLVFFFCIA